MSYKFIFTFHREKNKDYSESVGTRDLLWITSLPLCRGSFWEIKCLNVWSCLRHKYWVVFGTMYQNHWYFLICGEGYESGSLSGMSIKNNLVSFRRGHDFVIPVFLWLLCPDLLFAKTLRSQVSRVCADSLWGQTLLSALSLLQNTSAMMHNSSFLIKKYHLFQTPWKRQLHHILQEFLQLPSF